MGLMASTIVISYRLNKEHKEKKNICQYLYGKCCVKNERIIEQTNPLLREKESSKDIRRSISR